MACASGETDTCYRVSARDLATSRGDRWNPSIDLLDEIVRSAREAGVDPRVLLAVLIRESGDRHLFDWLSQTPFGRLHDFSIGISNMRQPAFAEARTYAAGAIDFGWQDIGPDSPKAVRAAAFLLAKRTDQLGGFRSRRFTAAQYVRVGYRAGADTMRRMEQTGQFVGGVVLFDLAYETAGRLLGNRISNPFAHAVPPGKRATVITQPPGRAQPAVESCDHAGPLTPMTVFGIRGWVLVVRDRYPTQAATAYTSIITANAAAPDRQTRVDRKPKSGRCEVWPRMTECDGQLMSERPHRTSKRGDLS